MNKFFLFFLVSLLLTPFLFTQDCLAQTSPPAPAVDNTIPVTLTEQKIYIPYEHLQNVLKQKEKGVFIPYSDFIKLWEEATKKPPEKLLPPPPIDAAIIHAEYTGTVYDDIAQFHAELKISALKEKWARLILNIKDMAITSLSLNGKTPLLKPTAGGLELVLPEKGDYVLEIDFSTRVNTVPGKKFVRFQVPSSPLTKIDMTIPGKNLDVKIEPMLSNKSHVSEDNTEFSAFISPEGKVNISWLAKSSGVKELESLIFARLSTVLYVRESVYTINTQIDFSVMQAKTDSFKIKIPLDLSLVSVDGKNIKDWEMNDEGILNINLYEAVDGNYTLSVATEKYRETGEKKFDVPVFEIIDAKREDGIIVIKSDPSLRVKAEKLDKVNQVDPEEIKGKISLTHLTSVFKYLRRPYLIQLDISKIQPKITAQQNILISFSETLIDYYTHVNFKVKDAGVFTFQFQIPDGFRVVDVGTEKTVDNFSVSKEEKRTVLTVVLKNKAYGQYSLPIHLEADKEDKNISLDLPRLLCLNTEKEDGIIALSLRKNLKLSTEEIKSLRPISLEEIRSMGLHVYDENNEIAAGYRYSTTDYSSTLNIDKRKTKIMARVERNISMEEAAMKINDRIHYNILYAPVSRFRIECLASLGKEAVITGNNIKEKRFLADEGTENGIWEIVLHAPRLGRLTLNLNLEKKLDSIKTGEKKTIHVPVIRVLDVFNESGSVSIMKSPNLQVEAAETGLEPIDTKELPASMNKNQAVLAFRYLTHPYSLILETTKHEYEKILDTIVNQAHFDIVVSHEGIAKTEGVFKIQNTNRQSLEITMPEGTDKIYSVFISGKKASISRGSSDRSKIIMLPKDITPGKEFTLRIIYQSKIRKDFGFFGALRVENAEIEDIPCSKITWRLYLPEGYSYLYMDGAMSARSSYHSAFANISSLIPSQRTYSPNRVNFNDQQILQQNDEKSLYGLDVDIVREGRLYFFSKLDKNAYLNIWFIKKTAMFHVSLIFLLLCGSLFTYTALKIKLNQVQFITLSFLLAFLLKTFVPQGFKYFAFLLMAAIIISGGVLFLLFLKKQKKDNAVNKQNLSSRQ